MWTKISPRRGRVGFNKRETPAVSRFTRAPKIGVLVLPEKIAGDATRADVFTDLEGRAAFRLGHKGAYAVRSQNKTGATRIVTIPAELIHLVPYGTTDCSLEEDGGMLVLDLNQFRHTRRLETAAE